MKKFIILLAVFLVFYIGILLYQKSNPSNQNTSPDEIEREAQEQKSFSNEIIKENHSSSSKNKVNNSKQNLPSHSYNESSNYNLDNLDISAIGVWTCTYC
jgi:hypothetical protein